MRVKAPGTKIKDPSQSGRIFFSAGEDLFFQGAATQVSSARVSLTTVFGKGTGGTSQRYTPAGGNGNVHTQKIEQRNCRDETERDKPSTD